VTEQSGDFISLEIESQMIENESIVRRVTFDQIFDFHQFLPLSIVALVVRRRSRRIRRPTVQREGKIPFEGDSVFAWMRLLPIPNGDPLENDRRNDRGEDLSDRQGQRMERRGEGEVAQQAFVEKQQTNRIDDRVERIEAENPFKREMFAVGIVSKDPMQNELEKNFPQKSTRQGGEELTEQNGESAQLDVTNNQRGEKDVGGDRVEDDPAADRRFPGDEKQGEGNEQLDDEGSERPSNEIDQRRNVNQLENFFQFVLLVIEERDKDISMRMNDQRVEMVGWDR
jgi:hypothetical protein